MRRFEKADDEDRGTTLIELMVAMGLMTVFMVMFTGAIILIYGTVNKAQSRYDGADQLNTAFNRLDTTVRYAAAIDTPGKVNGDADGWYVELLTTNTGTPVCTQLRVHDEQLQRRTWTVVGTAPNTTADDLSGWLPLASGITNGDAALDDAANRPFTLTPASNVFTFQQLTVVLHNASGGDTNASTSDSKLNFTALNSTITTEPTGFCKEVARK